jgi:hypothetical protein
MAISTKKCLTGLGWLAMGMLVRPVMRLSNNHLVQHPVFFCALPKTVIVVGLLATSVAAVKGGGASETEKGSYLQKSVRGLANSDSDKVHKVSIVLMCY